MSCDFCRSTPVSPCPVCSVAPTSAPIRKVKGTVRAAPKTVASPRVRPSIECKVCGKVKPWEESGAHMCNACFDAKQAPAPAVKPSAAVVDAPKASSWSKADVVNVAAAQIAEFYAARQYNMAMALVIGLADQDKREDRLSILVLIDQNAKTRGFLSERDDQTRREIGKAAHAEFVAIHGFDPKVPRQTAPKAPDAPVAVAPSKPLALPAPRGPLKSGDWADLVRRVDAGELTDKEAEEIGQIWIGAVPPNDFRA